MRFPARWGIGFVGWLALAAPAHAAFPGGNGMLAVQPLDGRGLILVRADGADERRVCTAVSVCGFPRRPRFSPDGRAIVFAGPAIRLIATDGRCMNCQFGVASSPAFRPGGTLVTFVSAGGVLEDGIDGLRQGQLGVGVREVSDAVWSVSGELAVVARGRVWIGKPGRLRSIGPGSAPSWSPDGSRLVIVRRGWITIVRATNGWARRLVRGTAPAFSPDGRWIAFIDLQHRLRVIRSVGGRARWVGRVRGLSVDWQPLPARPAACVAPAGSKVIASSAQAVVTTDARAGPGGGGLPDTAAMGCLFADGREQLLERSTFNSIDDATDYPVAAVGGTYAAIVGDTYDEHYGADSRSVAVFDLRTGARSRFGGESSNCADFSSPTCTGIDQIVVGADGVSAVHVNGGPLTPYSDPLQVLCGSASLCLATNNFGDVLSSTSPTQSPWSPATGASMNSGGAGGGSCPSVSLCVLVAGPSIFTSTDPSAGSWTTTRLAGSPGFIDVDCPTTSLCVATTGHQVAVSTDPTGGASAWSLEDVDGNNSMIGVSCPSASECIATDLAGNVITTTNPTGGPSAWSVRKANASGMSQLSCPSTSLCVAQVFTCCVAVSTDPISGPWTITLLTGVGGVFDLSCPSSSLCVKVAGDSIGFSTDPASGTWSTYTIPSAMADLHSVSCPTTSFCVAASGGGGDVFVSTNPTGGASTWTPVLADKIDCAIAPGACGTEQIIASDRTGVHVLDKSTEFELQTGPQLTGLALNSDTLSWQDHGSPTSAQLTP
jgi:hypothetical protein